MELAVYGALTTMWWLSSMTVLLPFVMLLKYSKFFRDRWFSFFFLKIIIPSFGPVLRPLRKKAFAPLEKHLANRDKSRQLEVLEIGIGGGANLEYYPENSSLTAVDMNESFEEYFVQNRKKYPHIKYAKTVIGMAEDMHEVEDSSIDLVISTFVLCSVKEVHLVLNEVKRVLKPGGKFLFLEHEAYPKSQWSNTLQRFAAPLWTLYFDGCMPHRDITEKIEQAGFAEVEKECFFPSGVMLFVRPTVHGIATK